MLTLEKLPNASAQRRTTGADEQNPAMVPGALATALERASAAGQCSAVEVLARELEARRKARAGVVHLDVERKRRDR